MQRDALPHNQGHRFNDDLLCESTMPDGSPCNADYHDTPRVACKGVRRDSRGTRDGDLTPEDVRAIRESDEGLTAIAERYGVNRQTILDIRNGVRWREVA